MSWYIVKPKQKSLKYYAFSTVVMGAISPKMYRAEMLQWLKEQERCEGFYDPRPYNEQFPEVYPEPLSEGTRDDLALTYWNGSFWYVTEEDNYFV